MVRSKQIIFAIAICLMFVLLASTSTMADITKGLVAYWPLDEGSGGKASDVTGNGHDGTLEKGLKWALAGDSKEGKGALAFDGTDDLLTIGSFDIVDGSGITIACWFKASNLDTPGNDPRMVSKAIGGANDAHWYMLSSSRVGGQKVLRFRLRTDGITSELKARPEGSIELDAWIHAVATWDGATMKLYKNAVEVGSLPKAGKLDVDPKVNMAIGNQPEGAENRPFEGIIDDVALWNRALTEAEINEVMTGGIPSTVEPDGKLTTTWGALKH